MHVRELLKPDGRCLRLYSRALTPNEINFNRITGSDHFNLAAPIAVNDEMILNPGAMARCSVCTP